MTAIAFQKRFPAALILASLLGSAQAEHPKPAHQPNIIFILADDLGYQSIGAYGGRQYLKGNEKLGAIQTPNLDALAAGGMRFDYAFSCPVCSPSRGELMTGLENHRIGLPDITGRRGSVEELDVRQHRTLPQTLREAGYATAMAGKWHLGRTTPAVQKDTDQTNSPHVTDAGFERQYNTVAAHLRDYGPPVRGKYTPDAIQSWVLRYLDSRKGVPQPFFLYYAAPVPHTPLKPTPLNPDGPAEGIGNYPFIMEYFDRQIGELVLRLDELGLRENTVLFFAGDNGTQGVTSEMADGRLIAPGKASMKDTGSQVPLIANWPGVIKPGSVSSRLVDFTDFLPTCLELAGVTVPSEIDGVSFAPQLRGQAGATREWVHVLMVDKYFVRNKKYKLREDGTLYDVSRPPDETPIPPDQDTAESKVARADLHAVMKQLHPETAGKE